MVSEDHLCPGIAHVHEPRHHRSDVNRKSTDEASVLKTVLALLRRILGLKGSAPDRYQEWTVTELKLVRASVGTLLNMTLKYGERAVCGERRYHSGAQHARCVRRADSKTIADE